MKAEVLQAVLQAAFVGAASSWRFNRPWARYKVRVRLFAHRAGRATAPVAAFSPGSRRLYCTAMVR